MIRTDLLKGRIVLNRTVSEINGELVVIRDLVYGTYIHGGGLPQSGGLAEVIWKQTLSKFKNQKPEIKSVLIIGLGGGSIAKLTREYWPEAEITGVDIDPVIVELGKKYLKLDKSNVDIHIQDAEVFIKEQVKKGNKFDLVCFDTYVKTKFPKKFETIQLIKLVKKLLFEKGAVIFNRLYGSKERDNAVKFEKVLKKAFNKIDRVYPEANIMFICS